MTDERCGMDEEIERALESLDSHEGNPEPDAKAEAAFRSLIRLLPQARPSHDFSNRVMVAVRNVPLAAGRRKLRSGRQGFIAVLASAAIAAIVCTTLWSTGVAQLVLARAFVEIVQSSLSVAHLIDVIMPASRWMFVAIGTLTEAISSTEMVGTFLIMTLLTVLPLLGLRQLVTSSSKER
jgi:hypothetical protein